MKTLPFDAAEYLDTEEAIAAYLADAGEDGAEALSRATEVVARARELWSTREPETARRASPALAFGPHSDLSRLTSAGSRED